MTSLFTSMFLHLWKLIRTRFVFWNVVISLILLLLSLQFYGSSHSSLIIFLYSGVSFDEILSHHIHLPIFWLTYFIIPNFIILDAPRILSKSHLIQIRGFQYSHLQFEWVSLMGTFLITFIYALFSFTWIVALMKINHGQTFSFAGLKEINSYLLFFLLILLGLICLILIQAIFNLINPILGIILPFSWLIFTSFTTWKLNPMNGLMLMRYSIHNTTQTFIFCIILIIIFTTIFLSIVKKKDFI
ncbi:hypothetical protein [Lactococcus lactis]|nr:hypothetical protein [Lactococcus lactis]NYZ59813.1 hypothetical protein [Lactococcus lactis]